MPTVLNVNPLDIDFTDPKIVMGQDFTCHYQYASLHDESLYLQTPSFLSKGPSKSRFNDQLQLFIPKACTSTLLKIDERAKQAFKCPPDAPKHWKKRFENENVYKELKSDKLYLKFSKDLKCFNEKGEVIHRDLTAGRYTLILHVIGIFIGNHGSTQYLASLQVKIKQVQFEPQSQTESLFIQPTPPHRRGGTLSKFDIDDLPTEVGDDESENLPRRKKRKVQKQVTSASTSNDDEDDDDDDDKDLVVRSKKARKLLKLFRLNNYGTQHPTEEEQRDHDKFLESLDEQLCDLLGQDWQVKYL